MNDVVNSKWFNWGLVVAGVAGVALEMIEKAPLPGRLGVVVVFVLGVCVRAGVVMNTFKKASDVTPPKTP